MDIHVTNDYISSQVMCTKTKEKGQTVGKFYRNSTRLENVHRGGTLDINHKLRQFDLAFDQATVHFFVLLL